MIIFKRELARRLMKGERILQQRMMIMGLLAMLMGLVGCADNSTPRDFNELIPRLMKPVNSFSNPSDAAANLFNVTSPDERRDAIAWLATKPYGHEAAYMKAYKILTTDPHPMVRAQAMRALGSSHKYDEAVPYLIDGGTGKKATGLADAEPEVRRDAARGLQETFNDTAIPALAEHLLKDTDEQVRVGCARALKWGRSPMAYRALIDALDDRDAGVVYWAHQSLETTTGQRIGFDPKASLAWYQHSYGQTTQPAPKG